MPDAGATAIREAFASKQVPRWRKGSGQADRNGLGHDRGQFVYDGTPPEMQPYSVTKEQEICALSGKAPLQETLVGRPSSKGIKNVVVFLRDASRVHESAAPKNDPVEFDQKDCVFLTHVVGVTVGQTVDIKNSDPIGHNTNIVGTGFNPTVPGDGAVPYPVQKEVSVPNQVKCGIHPWMTAYMLQRKNGTIAVTDAQGQFRNSERAGGRAAASSKFGTKAAPRPEAGWSARRPMPRM